MFLLRNLCQQQRNLCHLLQGIASIVIANSLEVGGGLLVAGAGVGIEVSAVLGVFVTGGLSAIGPAELQITVGLAQIGVGYGAVAYGANNLLSMTHLYYYNEK